MSTQNTLTGLIPIIQEALDIVSAEKIGFIHSVAINAKAEGAAKDETLRIPIVPAASASASWAPAQTAPDTGNITVGYVDMSIDVAKTQPVRWNGEEEKGLRNAGTYESIMRDRFAQAFRMHRNEMEAVIGIAAKNGASRAYGTAGTTPFGSDITAAMALQKILDDNGCSELDRYLVIDTTAAFNLGSLVHLTQVNTAGSDALLRRGVLTELAGFKIMKSGQVAYHTKGTMTGQDGTAIEPVGEVNIAVDGGTSGTILPGDIITKGNEGAGAVDANKYVVASGGTATTVGSSGYFTLNTPGVLIITAVTDEYTIGSSYRANIAFQKQAIQFVERPLAFPAGGDAARDRTIVTDPISGLSFSVSMYGEYGQMHYSIGCCYTAKAIKPDNIAILLG